MLRDASELSWYAQCKFGPLAASAEEQRKQWCGRSEGTGHGLKPQLVCCCVDAMLERSQNVLK